MQSSLLGLLGNLGQYQMKNTAHNTFKQDKKLKQLERKKQRDNKQKAFITWQQIEIVK